MRLYAVCALSSLLVLAACGGGGGGSPSLKRSAQEPLTAESPMVVPSYNFSEGMGLLIVKKANTLGVCTSFLISPNQLMTNSHCLEDISLTQSCANNVVVHVKTAFNGMEFHRCKRIITRSKIDGDFGDPDFAVIELDSDSVAKPKSLSREGVQELSELTIESVDYTGSVETLYANRKISRCTPHMNAAIGNYSNPKSSIIPVYGDAGQTCNVIPGNSGSPITNASGKVVSVIFATLYKDRLRERLNVKNPHDTALATNLACIKTNVPWFDRLRPVECDAVMRDEAQYMSRLEAQFNRGKEENRKAKAEELKRDLPGAFSFSLDEKRESKVEEKEKFAYNFKPTCMKSPDSWSDDEKLKIFTEAGIRKYSTAVSSYAYTLDIQFDEYLRPEVSSVLAKTGYYELIVENIDSTDALIKIKIAKTENGVVKTTDQQVPRCQKL